VRFILAKRDADTDQLKIIGAKMNQDRENWETFYDLEEGEYLCYVQVDWEAETEMKTICLNSYSSTQTAFTRNETAYFEQSEFLSQCFLEYAVENGTATSYEKHGLPEATKYSQITKFGFGYICFDNQSEDTSIQEEVTYTEFEGLELMKPYRGASYEITVGPGEKKIIILNQTSPRGYKMKSSAMMKVIFGEGQLKKKAVEEGKVRAKQSDGQEIDIVQYTL
jgi:hypothetical protein